MNQKGKGYANLILIILPLVIVTAIGYLVVTVFFSPQVTPKNTAEIQPDDCNFISDSTFRSVNKYEVGLGPNGPAMGYWSITFQKGNFQWHHSDVVESGSYLCKNNILQAKLYTRSVTANYDINRKALIWENVEYSKVD